MTTRFRHFTFGLLALVCASVISSCTSDEVGQTLTVNFDGNFNPKQVTLTQPDTTKPVSSTNAKTAVFDVIAVVTYKGKKSLEYIWSIDSTNIAVGYSIKPDSAAPFRATVTLTYPFPVAASVFDGSMPIKLLVKEKDGSITDSDTTIVDVFLFGSSSG